MAVTEPEIFKIVLVANLKRLQPIDIHTADFVNKVSVLKSTKIIDDLQRRYIDTLWLEITADIVGREEIADIVGRVTYQRLKEIDIAYALALYNVFEKDGREYIAEILWDNVLLEW